MIKFTLLATILLYSFSLLGQENKFNSKVYNSAGPNAKFYSNKNSKTPIYDFSQCKNDDYKKCFKDIDTPVVFDFSNCKDKKAANTIYFKSLTNFIHNNLDKKTLDFFSANLRENDSIYSFKFTYYINNKGEAIPDLIGSTVKRTNYEIHKKLEFLLSKTRIEKGKFSSSLKNKQRFVYMAFKPDSITNELILLPFNKKKKPEFNLNDSLTVPLYKGCHELADKYSQKTYNAEKRCMEHHISNLVKESLNNEMRQKAPYILANEYGIYDKKIKTIATFKFDNEGYTTDIKTLGMVPEIEDELERILKTIPKAQAGTKKGKPVNVIYNLPLIFKTMARR